MMRHMIRRAWLQWERWRHARRVRKAYPNVAIMREIAAETARRKVKSEPVRKALREMVHRNLKTEMTR